MSRRILILAALLLAAGAGQSAAADLHRGTYYQSPEHGFALWIPAGYVAAEPRSEPFLARFTGSADGAYAVEILKPESRPLSRFVEERLKQAGEQFPAGDIEVIREVDAGGRSAVVIVFRKLDGNPAFENTEMVQAFVPLDDEVTLCLLAYSKTGGWENAVAVARWVLATLRYLGDGSLDAYLAGRRVHPGTGLSFRPPQGFRDDGATDPAALYSGAQTGTGVRITVASAASASSLEAALVGSTPTAGGLRSWPLPAAAGLVLRGALIQSGQGISARVAAEAGGPNGPRFLVTVSGKSEQAEAMLRTAELVALTFRMVDMVAAREKASTAGTALEAALRRRHHDLIKARVTELCEYAFLEPVAESLLKTILRLEDPALQTLVARSIAVQEFPALAPELLRLARNSKIRLNSPVLAAVLEALGSSRSKNAIATLLEHVTQGDSKVAGAAIRSLGRYVEHRDRVVRRLITLMERTEAAARPNDYAARERWDALRPAFQQALESLTGERFRTAGEATHWLRNQHF
ncbi:MAG: HEAT repeat domain-containing protein [Planctomycetes bacterium]|nr:HEAT repeat domain-containing protein [Planctomycetota bacterium]